MENQAMPEEQLPDTAVSDMADASKEPKTCPPEKEDNGWRGIFFIIEEPEKRYKCLSLLSLILGAVAVLVSPMAILYGYRDYVFSILAIGFALGAPKTQRGKTSLKAIFGLVLGFLGLLVSMIMAYIEYQS